MDMFRDHRAARADVQVHREQFAVGLFRADPDHTPLAVSYSLNTFFLELGYNSIVTPWGG
jgi:hypothetical protein